MSRTAQNLGDKEKNRKSCLGSGPRLVQGVALIPREARVAFEGRRPE